MKKVTYKEKAFIKWVKKQCKLYGVKCSLRHVSYVKVDNNIQCAGYFDDEGSETPVLVVAMNRLDWLEILVHEYCHLTQWKDRDSLWNKAGRSLILVDDWLNDKPISKIDYHLSMVRDLELDNEKRAVELIKKWDLDIDIDNYIKKANAYVQFYNYLKISRRWSRPENSPYKNINIINAMSPKFNMNYKKMSSKIEKLFIKENI